MMGDFWIVGLFEKAGRGGWQTIEPEAMSRVAARKECEENVVKRKGMSITVKGKYCYCL